MKAKASNSLRGLRAIKTVAEVYDLYAKANTSERARRHYANLGFFLHTFAPPNDSSYREKVALLKILAIFDKEGILKPGHLHKYEADMREAMKKQGD
jgi:hypothetical protein